MLAQGAREMVLRLETTTTEIGRRGKPTPRGCPSLLGADLGDQSIEVGRLGVEGPWQHSGSARSATSTFALLQEERAKRSSVHIFHAI